MINVLAYVLLVICVTAPLCGSWIHIPRPRLRRHNRSRDRELHALIRHDRRTAR